MSIQIRMQLITYLIAHLVTSQQGVEQQASVGQRGRGERVGGLHTARVRGIGLAHVRDVNVVVGAISCTILVFFANVCGGGVREIVVHCRRPLSP